MNRGDLSWFFGALLFQMIAAFALAQGPGLLHQDESSSDAASVVETTPGTTPATSVEREIDLELARIDDALQQAYTLRDAYEHATTKLDRSADAAREHVAELTVALRGLAADSDPADKLYESIVSDLQTARGQLGEALETWQEPSAVPGYSPGLDLDTVEAARFRERITRARELLATLAVAEAAARDAEHRVRWKTVEQHGDKVSDLNELRIASLKTLSPAKRDLVLGVSRDGIGQLMREVNHVVLAARL